MNIPYGYGNCLFRIYAKNGESTSSYRWYYFRFKISADSYPVDTNIGYEYVNIYGNYEKSIEKIMRRFDIKIIKDDTNQYELVQFIYALKNNARNYVLFHLHEPTFADYNWIYNLMSYQCIISEPALSNLISGFYGAGNTIDLTLNVKNSLLPTDDKIKYIPYRNTDNGNWNTYPPNTIAISPVNYKIGISTSPSD